MMPPTDTKTATIRFAKGDRAPIEVPTGTTLMQALLDAGVPVASSCRGDGVCAKCRIEITDGRKNLTPENSLELYLRERFQIEKAIRVSCQTQILGDITVTTSYW